MIMKNDINRYGQTLTNPLGGIDDDSSLHQKSRRNGCHCYDNQKHQGNRREVLEELAIHPDAIDVLIGRHVYRASDIYANF